MNGQRITNENIDQYLIGGNRPIKRIGNAKFARDKIDWQCLMPNCNYVWAARSDHVKRGSGCPKCANILSVTNDNMDQWLIDNKKPIKRIGTIKNTKDKINWSCLIESCGHLWSARTNDIKHDSGCPKCADCIFISNSDMDRWLIDNKKPIKRIGEMSGVHIKIYWQCLECNNIWLAPPAPIRYRDQGCPICNTLGHNQKLILDFLIKNNIIFEKEKNIKELDTNEIRSLRIDFYFASYRIAIEYNGLQHYKPWRFSNMSIEEAKIKLCEQQERDEYKRVFCQKNNIKLIEIDGRIYKDNKLITYIGEIVNDMKEKQYV